jgi:PKD repeat protein
MERDNLIQIVTLIIAVVALILAVFSVAVPGDEDEDDKDVDTPQIQNVSPTAIITLASNSVEEMQNVLFDASQSFDTNGTIVEYTWDFGDNAKDSGMYSNHAYSTEGSYTVTLIVIDNEGATETNSTTITVTAHVVPYNIPPVASLLISQTTVDREEYINYDGSSSTDSDGDIVEYIWDFGDGTNSTGIFTNHYYVSAGTYTIKLTVTDDDGAQNSTSGNIVVYDDPAPPVNVPPEAAFLISSTNVEEYTYINLNGSTSSDSDGTIVEYAWHFGDGSITSGRYASHFYSLAGNYTITLNVVDDDGASDITSVLVTVTEGSAPSPNQAPTAVISANRTSIIAHWSIHFNASGSSDSDGTIVEFSWDFGDGAVGSGILIDHVYHDFGTFNAVLTIYDNDGAKSSDSIIIDVVPAISGTLDFSKTGPGEFTGGIVSLSDILTMTNTRLEIIDESLGASSEQNPIESGVTLNISGGLNFTFVDININYEVDSSDEMIMRNAEPGDKVKLIFIPTGEVIATYTITETAPTGALSFSENTPGNYTGGVISLSDTVYVFEASIYINDTSTGINATQIPIQSGIWLQAGSGLRIKYTDSNANSKIDAGDVWVVENGGSGDIIKLIYVPTGTSIAEYTLT